MTDDELREALRRLGIYDLIQGTAADMGHLEQKMKAESRYTRSRLKAIKKKIYEEEDS